MYKDETGETVPAIVSEELWDKANEVLYMRSQDVITAQHKTVHQNLLTGKLLCAHCGMPYYRKDAVSKAEKKSQSGYARAKLKTEHQAVRAERFTKVKSSRLSKIYSNRGNSILRNFRRVCLNLCQKFLTQTKTKTSLTG